MAYTPDPDDDLDFGDLSTALAQAAEGANASTIDTRTQLLSPGVILEGRFRIEAFVDSGGMGQVYRATDTAIDAPVALKLVRVSDQFRDDTERDRRVKRVIREITAARGASQRCGHILSIYDIRSLPSGDPYIVMEYLDGENLRDWIDLHAPAHWTAVRDIAVQLAAALKALHRPGFVHRDIKPANIFALEGDESVPFIKLIDFGIVKDLEAASMTATAASLGTMRYMSPEAFSRTAKITDRSDIFGVGLVLYEALCGLNPMPVEHNALIDIYTDGVPSILKHLDENDVPAWLSAIIDSCLHLAPAERPSAAELHAALSAAPSASTDVLSGQDGIEAAPDSAGATELRDALDTAIFAPPVEQVAVAPVAPAAPSTPLTAALGPDVGDDARLGMPFEDDLPTYELAQRPPQRSSLPLAFAVFAGFCVLAGAMLFMPETDEPTPNPVISIASEPELEFRPTGPVGPEDFPAAPPSIAAPNSAAPASIPSVTRAQAESIAPAAIKRPVVARSKRPRRSRKPRKGVSNSFAQLRDSALLNAGAAPSTPAPQAGGYAGAVKYADGADDGAQFFDTPQPKIKVVSLPVGSKLKARLVSGISSSKHATVVARLSADVLVDGVVVLAKGDVIKGRSSNDSQRVFIDFRQGIHGGQSVKFAGHAVTSALPGLPATKKTIPKDERGTNVVARGALTTAGSVAARIGGGVAGELAGDVAHEGVTEARPDFRERQPFVLTVPEGVRFTVIVTGS